MVDLFLFSLFKDLTLTVILLQNVRRFFFSFSDCSEIFCHGRLIHAVQMSQIFNDSKTFVDMKLKTNPERTLILFDEFIARHAPNQPSNEDLKVWVNENFEDVGSEFENWTPDDWKDNPKFLDGIADVSLREWASDLNHIWLDLGRKMKKEVEVCCMMIENEQNSAIFFHVFSGAYQFILHNLRR
jgi:Trehalase